MIYIYLGIQFIAILLLISKIQGNTKDMENEKVDLATIKATNQRTTIIFLLIEILMLLTIILYPEISDILKIYLLQQ